MRAIRNWRRNRPAADDLAIFPAVGVLFLTCLLLLNSVGVHAIRISSYFANSVVYVISIILLISIEIVWVLCASRPDRPLGFLKRYFTLADHGRRIVAAMPMIAALAVFMPAFSAMKSSIPLFNAYSWDTTFIDLDRAIHGMDAWRLLQPVLGYPLVTSALSVVYHLWILLIYVGGIHFALYEHDSALRQRYFISFFAVWSISGLALAIALASVGPCFAAPIMGIHVFDEQMAYLHKANEQFPVMVLDVQQQLLGWYRSGNHGLGRGITAMPSLHVAQAFLFFLAMRHKARWLGWCFGGFAFLILIGSVHLGYHYAVDGYFAIAVTALVWLLAGRFVARRRAVRRGERAAADTITAEPIRDLW